MTSLYQNIWWHSSLTAISIITRPQNNSIKRTTTAYIISMHELEFEYHFSEFQSQVLVSVYVFFLLWKDYVSTLYNLTTSHTCPPIPFPTSPPAFLAQYISPNLSQGLNMPLMCHWPIYLRIGFRVYHTKGTGKGDTYAAKIYEQNTNKNFRYTTGPVFCLLLGIYSGCAQPITGQVT